MTHASESTESSGKWPVEPSGLIGRLIVNYCRLRTCVTCWSVIKGIHPQAQAHWPLNGEGKIFLTLELGGIASAVAIFPFDLCFWAEDQFSPWLFLLRLWGKRFEALAEHGIPEHEAVELIAGLNNPHNDRSYSPQLDPNR